MIRTIATIFFLVLFVAQAQATEKKLKQTLPRVAKPYKALDFHLKGTDGKVYTLSQYRGKVVIINFWATWCPPCRYEMPSMERAWKKIRNKGVVMLAINVGEDEDKIFDFTGTYPVSFPILMDIKGTVIAKYPVIGLPTTYIVSPNGMVTHRAVGSREWDDPVLLKQILALR